jgi:hypothetical protein
VHWDYEATNLLAGMVRSMVSPGRGIGLCWAILTGVVGCVQHPTKGVDNHVPNTPASPPWEAQVTVSGAYPATGVPIEIDALNLDEAAAGAGNAGPTYTTLTTVTATGNQVVSPGLPPYFVWQTQITIPQRFWRAGISAGFEARLLARALVDGAPQPLTLGTPEHPGSPALCLAYKNDPNAFGSADVQNQAKIACSSTPSDEELQFVFDSDDFNDHCSRLGEACCAGQTGCDAPNLCDTASNRCVAPATPPGGTGGTPGGQGGVPDSAKCQKGDVQLVAGFTPPGCPAGFTITAAKHCNTSTGKFNTQPTANECNETDLTADPGADCFCNISGDACGQAAGEPCTVQTTTGDLPGVCSPGNLCVINTGNGATGFICAALGSTPTPDCWKLSDVKQTNLGSSPGPGDGGSGGTGGSTGTAGTAAAGKGGA